MQEPIFNTLDHITDGGDLRALQTLVRRLGERSEVLVEIGSWTGASALAMHAVAPWATIYCVDTWGVPGGEPLRAEMAKHSGTEVLATFCKNVGKRLLRHIVPLRGTSVFWAGAFTLKADLIFLDGGHAFGSVELDILSWKYRLRPGGIMCGHDYSPQFPGVIDAVRGAFGDHVQRIGKSVWYVEMP